MATNMLCTVFTVTLLVAGIQATVEPQSTSPAKHVPVTSVFPPSLLFLLSRRPIEFSPLRPRQSESPSSLSLPASPLAPSSPFAPTSPYIPNVPVAPTLQSGQLQPRYPLITPQFFSSPFNAVPPTRTLSYANGNRKLLNAVHIPLRKTPSIEPVPLGAIPLNYESQDNTATSPQQGSSNPNIAPLGALPLNAESDTANSEDLTPVPIYTIGASPIPGSPNDNDKAGSSDSKDVYTFNPKDIPYQPIDNIEASPIPVRPQNDSDDSKNTSGEDLAPDLSDSVGTSIPSKPDKSDGKNASDNEKSITIKIKDLASQPVGNIAASPIPVKPKNKLPLNLEAAESNFEPDEESSGSANNERSNDQNESSESNGEPQNPLRDVILNGPPPSCNDGPSSNPLGNVLFNGSSPSNNNGPPSNPLGDVLLNGTSSNDDSNPEENPEDQIFNGSSPIENEENDSESFESEAESSESDDGKTKVSQSESFDEKEESNNNGDIESSETEEQESEETSIDDK